MCGIGGYFKIKDPGGAPALDVALRHRGPDGAGRFVDRAAALYHTRLSIIDLSDAATQPMTDETGQVVIVYNGEIYNFQELRERLIARGHRFQSHSDTEVVLRLYIEHGEGFVRHLRGMFAFAIYDKRGGPGREALILARDPFGIKPLLYAETAEGGVVFASELKTMLASGKVAREVDPVALRDLLTVGSVYQPRTLLRGVRALLPGRIAVYQGRRRRETVYWKFGAGRVSGLADATDAEAAAAVDGALSDSVRRQLVADVPICCFLSGGIDSALTTAIMARHHNSQVCTYSVGFDGPRSPLDETADAAVVAQHLETDHHEVLIRDRDVAELMGRLGSTLDQPSIDGVNSYFVSRAVARDYKVALSGTGGDELFAGYPWFNAASAYQPPTGSALAWLGRRLLPWPQEDNSLAAKWAFSDVAGYFNRQHQIFGLGGAARAMAPHLRADARGWRDSYLDIDSRDTVRDNGILNRCSALCLAGYTSNQLLRDIDATSMSCGIEVRVPFLDPVVADVAMSLPERHKAGAADRAAPAGSYAASGIKKVLLDVGQRYLPADFATRPKRGFNMPVADWLRGPLRELAAETLDEARVERAGLLDPKFAGDVRADFEAGRATGSNLWLLLVTSLWKEQVLDG